MPNPQLIDQTIRRSFPHPIAAAWHRTSLATSNADRIKRLLACLEIVSRTLASVLLSDYLAGPPDKSTEKFLERLDRPSLGHWIGLIRSILRHVRTREEPPAFIPEAGEWYFRKGRPSDSARLLDELVELRNAEAHGWVLSDSETDVRATKLLSDMRRLMSDLGWLSAYRAFRVLQLQLARSGGFRGRLQFLTGVEPLTEPVNATWSARLFEDTVYVVNPTGDRILEVSPFLQVLHDSGPRADRCFLLASTRKGKMLTLQNDATGTTETALIDAEDTELPWDEWLAGRGERLIHHDNPSAAEALRAPQWGGGSDDADVLGDRFEVRSILGKGGMATVYLVWDRWEEAEFALKVLHTQLAEEQDFRERFKREARTMRRLHHPTILRVEETSALDDGRLYLKLPVLHGGTLVERIKAGATPPEQLLQWAHQMLSGLAYLHGDQVVHRDIKPSNYLLDSESNVLLSDFGIALRETDTRLTRSLEQMGSMAYMSPEQRRGQEAEAPSDIYSLGLVLHELATGQEGAVGPGEGVDDPIGAVIRAMCMEDPTARPTATDAIAMLPAPAAPAPPIGADPMYTYSGPDGQRMMALGELARHVRENPSQPHVVWQVGWDKWRPWGDVPEIVELVSGPPPVDIVGDVPLDTRPVEPGQFTRAPSGQQVTLTRAFRIGHAPISERLWDAVGRGDDADEPNDGVMTGMSWYQAIDLCNDLSEKTGLTAAYSFGEPTPRKRYSVDAMGRMLYDLVPYKLIPQILATFGAETLAVVQFEPKRLAEVPGLGKKTIDVLRETWDPDKYFQRSVTWDAEANGWRLPTEAEWEHAGCGEAPAQGDEAAAAQLHWEWVWDADGGPKFAVDPAPLSEEPASDPSGAEAGPRRMIRCGTQRKCRVPEDRSSDATFRLARNER